MHMPIARGVGCLVLLLGTTALAQVSPTYNQGQVLDASPMMGSGGYNRGYLQSGSSYGELLRSNLVVTGQVSGYGAFRGSTPYQAANQIRGALATDAYSEFNRLTVGVQDVTHGNMYSLEPTPYYSRSRTTLGAGDIASGRNLPGSDVPLSTSLNTEVTRDLYRQAIDSFRTPLNTSVGTRLYVPPVSAAREGLLPSGTYRQSQVSGILPTAPTGLQSEDVLGGVVSEPAQPTEAQRRAEDAARARIETQAFQPGAGALFGLSSPYRRQDLAGELARLEPLNTRLQTLTKQQYPYQLGSPQAVPMETDIDANLVAKQGTGPGSGPRLNADTFTDLLVRLRQKRLAVEDRTGLAPPPRLAPTEPSLVDLADGNVVVHGLAGLSRSRANQHMRGGEADLRAGRYYLAVEQFRMVLLLERGNPLPGIGMGLAYFCAGEPYSAGMEFHKAIRQFPPISEVRFDLPAMIEVDRAKEVIAQLERRLQKEVRPDPMLLLSMTFMHANLGNRSEAGRYADLLLKYAGDDLVFRTYAAAILDQVRSKR